MLAERCLLLKDNLRLIITLVPIITYVRIGTLLQSHEAQHCEKGSSLHFQLTFEGIGYQEAVQVLNNFRTNR